MFQYVSARMGQFVATALFALVLGAVSAAFMSAPAFAQHKQKEGDLELPTNDQAVVDAGRDKYAQRCSFCHGGGGKGGKGPCLTCGKFKYTGNTNAEIYSTIAGGISNKALGGTMGSFGTTMSYEEILSVVTFLRVEEKRRIESGEIPDPYKE